MVSDSMNLGLLYAAEFVGPSELTRLRDDLRNADRYPAVSYKGSNEGVRDDFRRTSRLRIAPDRVERVQRRLTEWTPRLESHFGVTLGPCQEPQFLAYSAGDFFRPHRDCGTGPTDPEPSRNRKVSVVILLNPGDYEGGVLTLHEIGTHGSKLEIRGRPGGLIAFHSLVLHEVTPVVSGERYSIAAWYEGRR